MSSSNLQAEKLKLASERLRFERQKFAIEVRQRRTKTDPQKPWKVALSNPTTLALIGAVLTLISGLLLSWYNSRESQELERVRARNTLEAELVKKFVEGPSPDAVRENLRFLVDANLVPTYAAGIDAYLVKNPGSAPQITMRMGVTGTDDAKPVEDLSASDPAVALSKGVGTVRVGGSHCTGFLIKADVFLSAGHCSLRDERDASVRVHGREVAATIVKREINGIGGPNFLILKISDASVFAGRELKLARGDVKIGDRLQLIMLRYGKDRLLLVSSPDCQVLEHQGDTFTHLCDTGIGSGGAPLFNTDGEVIGIHNGRTTSGAWATTIQTVIKQQPDVGVP